MNGSRSAWLDNAKGVLMILVIWGHLMELMIGVSPLAAGTYGAVYLFHMPAFAMVSGMVSGADLNRQTILQLGRKVLLPLAVFQLLYWPALALLKPGWRYDPLAPNWILWFLLSLMFWRLVLPVFIRLPYPVLTSVVIAVAVGFVDVVDSTLSLSRTFVFFPAFLAGYVYRSQIRGIAGKARPRAVVVLAVLLGGAGYLVVQGADVGLLYGRHPYAHDTPHLLMPALQRLLVIVSGVAAAIAFLALVPQRAGVLTGLGRQTLPVFLLHGFVVLVFWAVIPAQVYGFGAAFLVATGGLSVLLAFGLARLAQASLAVRAMRQVPG